MAIQFPFGKSLDIFFNILLIKQSGETSRGIKTKIFKKLAGTKASSEQKILKTSAALTSDYRSNSSQGQIAVQIHDNASETEFLGRTSSGNSASNSLSQNLVKNTNQLMSPTSIITQFWKHNTVKLERKKIRNNLPAMKKSLTQKN